MRKRTVLDIALLLLSLAVGGWLFSLRSRSAPEAPPAEPTATPRALEFIRGIDVPTPIPTVRPAPARRSTPEQPTDLESRVLVTVKGFRERSDLVLVGNGGFRMPLQSARTLLRVEPGTITLHLENGDGLAGEPRTLLVRPGATVAVEFTGVEPGGTAGLNLEPAGDYAIVRQVIPGTAAEAAGIQPGDVVTHLEDRPLAGLTADQIEALLAGAPGEPLRVRIIIRNDAGELEVHETLLERR